MRLCCIAIVFAFLVAGAAHAQEVELEVELTTPLGTATSRKGDVVLGKVISPDALQGDIVEGKVNNLRVGNKLRSESVLSFTFEILKHGLESVPISSQVKSVTNSKGQVDVDDEGHVLRKTNNLGKAAAGTGAGALIGGIAGGGRGAAIGAATGALISIVLIDIAAEGPSIRLVPGSRITLLAKSRSGPALASLSDNQSAAPAVAAAPAAIPKEAPAASPSTVPPASPAPAARPSTAAAPQQAPDQPDLTAVKVDFIPGDKTIFYDDFTDMAGDEPPPHWRVRGGSVALKVGSGIRQLTTAGKVRLAPLLKGFPKNFTLETERKFDSQNGDSRWYFHGKSWSGPLGPYAALSIYTKFDVSQKYISVSVRTCIDGKVEDPAKAELYTVDVSQPVKQSLWIQEGRLRVYINDQRLIDLNQIELEALTGAEFEDDEGIGYRLVRFAESSPDFSKIISSTGRYVTHGILFDVDSDRLKPESAPVIKVVARGLETNPNLRLLIEGHTDSTGRAEHNLNLSKRRAEAVKSVLVSQFKIDPERLTTDGLGASRPIDTNDTPAGRAQNRRVEFVRQ